MAEETQRSNSSVAIDVSTKHVVHGSVKVYTHDMDPDILDQAAAQAERLADRLLAYGKRAGAQP